MTNKRRFRLELNLSAIPMGRMEVDDPVLIDDTLVKQAWDLLGSFLMDTLDELEPDATDERFREVFIEVCYKLIYREMTTLHLLPIWEQNFKERLASGKRIQRLPRQEGESDA